MITFNTVLITILVVSNVMLASAILATVLVALEFYREDKDQ